MYIRTNAILDKPFQMVDFVSLKKKTPQKCLLSHQSKMRFPLSQEKISILLILAICQFTSPTQINQDVFSGFNLDQAPKQHQSFAHEKTMKALLKIVLTHANCYNTLVSFVDQFPIISFVLEAYCRALCTSKLKQKKSTFIHQNEQEILQNFGCELRGDLLNFMADTLGMHVTLMIGQFVQIYGSEGNRKKVTIKYSEHGVEAELMGGKKKENQAIYVRTNENSGGKNMKQMQSMETETSESQQVSSIESNSVVKEGRSEDGRCDKCRVEAGKCLCKKVFLTYTTPKSTASNNNQRSPMPGANSNIFSMLNHSKCVCHKLICNCRK